jgi:hypothetical protein
VAALVDEMDPQPVYAGAEVRERIERPLPCPPVEIAGPGGEQVTQVADVHAGVPAGPRDHAGPATAPDALAQIVEDGIVDGYSKRLDLHILKIRHYATVTAGFIPTRACRPPGAWLAPEVPRMPPGLPPAITVGR